MKTLNIKKINAPQELDAAMVPALLDQNGVEFQKIDNVNWKEYPYQPAVEFRTAHCGAYMLVNYRVTEASVRAVAPHDNGRVWEDSCCEFFVQPQAEEPVYYNFECNCAGTLLLNCGVVGDRKPASEEVLQSVKRWSTLGREPFEEKVGEYAWQMALVIPAKALFNHEVDNFSGLKLHGNFYKCGDLQQTPHFLSWNPIDLPTPCFHCPEFFGELVYEE